MPNRVSRPSRATGWGPVGLLVAATLALGVLAWLAGWHLGADSAVYRAGTLSLLRGEALYDSHPLSTLPDWVLLPFTYPPAAAVLFLPLAAVPAGLAWGALGAVSVLGLAAVLRVSSGGRLGGWALAGAAVLALGLEPVWKTLLLGQVNLILMAMVVLDVLVLCARGSRWGGVLVGLAAAVKLTPLIFLPHLLLTGRRVAALRGLVVFLLAQAVPFLLAPAEAARYWTRAASDPGRIGAVQWIFDQSLNGMVNRASELAPWSLRLALGIGLLLAIPAVWLVWRLYRRGEALAALLVTAFLALLVSPVSWSHHWVWAVPLIVLLVLRGQRLAALAVAALFACCVVMLVPNGGATEFGWGPLLSLPGNAYVLAAALAILGLAAAELRRDTRAGDRLG